MTASFARLACLALLASTVLACSSQNSGGAGGGGGGAGGGTTGASGGANGCRSSEDCAAQGLPNGLCRHPEDACIFDSNPLVGCTSDAECGDADERCFLCWNGYGTCLPACNGDAGCMPGTTCDATGHCARNPCAADADCPANFVCREGACARKTCSADAECASYCVDGNCVATLGTCEI